MNVFVFSIEKCRFHTWVNGHFRSLTLALHYFNDTVVIAMGRGVVAYPGHPIADAPSESLPSPVRRGYLIFLFNQLSSCELMLTFQVYNHIKFEA